MFISLDSTWKVQDLTDAYPIKRDFMKVSSVDRFRLGIYCFMSRRVETLDLHRIGKRQVLRHETVRRHQRIWRLIIFRIRSYKLNFRLTIVIHMYILEIASTCCIYKIQFFIIASFQLKQITEFINLYFRQFS